MEVTALTYSGGIGLHGRSPLLRLQSDDRLVALIRRGNDAAFEILVSRYQSRLLAFCRHMLGSREDAEDVLQDVMASAYNAMLSDERPINVRPWLYRIARNRSLNHLRRIQAVGVDSMDVHFHDHGASTADKVHEREEFRMLVGDIQRLPETQRTALVLREMDALSYDQIAEAMETTVPSVKSLLVRARIGLAEAAEARLLSCDEVRIELGEVAEGLQRKPSHLVRRHLKTCTRCEAFQLHLRDTNKALAVMLPIGPLVLLRKLLIAHLGHSAGSAGAGAGAGAAGAGAAGAGAAGAGAAGAGAAGAGAAAVGAGGGATGLVSAGVGALATKAAAGIAAAALVTAGAVEVDHAVQLPSTPRPPALPAVSPAASAGTVKAPVLTVSHPQPLDRDVKHQAHRAPKNLTADARAAAVPTATTPTDASAATTTPTSTAPTSTTPTGTTTTTTVVTVLPPPSSGSGPAGSSDPGSGTTTSTTPTSTTPTSTTSTSTTQTSTTPTSTTPTSTTPTSTTQTSTTPTSTTPASASSPDPAPGS